jgi:hypothetical protein
MEEVGSCGGGGGGGGGGSGVLVIGSYRQPVLRCWSDSRLFSLAEHVGWGKKKSRLCLCLCLRPWWRWHGRWGFCGLTTEAMPTRRHARRNAGWLSGRWAGSHEGVMCTRRRPSLLIPISIVPVACLPLLSRPLRPEFETTISINSRASTGGCLRLGGGIFGCGPVPKGPPPSRAWEDFPPARGRHIWSGLHPANPPGGPSTSIRPRPCIPFAGCPSSRGERGRRQVLPRCPLGPTAHKGIQDSWKEIPVLAPKGGEDEPEGGSSPPGLNRPGIFSRSELGRNKKAGGFFLRYCSCAARPSGPPPSPFPLAAYAFVGPPTWLFFFSFSGGGFLCCESTKRHEGQAAQGREPVELG